MREDNTELTDELWNNNDTESFNNETYHLLLVEQYKLYVEMTDRISARRNLANTYFLTCHAIVLSVLGITLSHQQEVHRVGFLLFPLLGLLVLCYAWWRLVQYFRRVTSARNKVIIELEKRMPSSPSMQAERKGAKDNPYKPLKSMEVALPIVFGLIYIFSFIYATHLT